MSVRPRTAHGSAAGLALLALAAALLPGSADAAPAPAASTVRVSVASDGRQSTGQNYAPAISADGRFVAFDSDSPALVAGDDNGRADVFVRDLKTGRTSLVSVSGSGAQGDDGSFTPAISGDGRWVAFVSDAANLVSGDTNGDTDVFLRDREKERTIRLSVAIDGRETTGGDSPQISRDGRFVVYNVGTPLRSVGTDEDQDGMFVYDTSTGARERLGHVGAIDPTISANGRYVAFHSEVRDLVAGDTNRKADCFLYDRKTRKVTRISLGPGGREGDKESTGAAISANGRFVTFVSSATNLVPGDTNAVDDVFIRNLRTDKTRRVSVDATGRQGDGLSGGAVLSANGRWLVFLSQANNLAPGDTNSAIFDVFHVDLKDGSMRRVNVGPQGAEPDGQTSSFPAISADGRSVAFGSRATNLVPGDTNGRDDIFVRRYR